MDSEILFRDEWNEADSADALRISGPILVVGASGFIGAKLFFSLLKRRDDVYAVSRQVEHSWRLLNVPYSRVRSRNQISVDITDPMALEEVIQRLRPRTVFNLSAYGAYERQRVVRRIHDVNYMGTLNLITSMMENGCDAFVQAGSSSEYGLNCVGPSENDELRPNSDYSVSKGAASLLVKYYGEVRNFPATNLRLYSIYGPWEERDRLIPNLISHGLQGKFPPFADPRISRDFVYVDDCLRAFVRAALTVCKTSPGLSLNIASGVQSSLAQVAQTVKEILQVPGAPEFGRMPNRKWDLNDWYGNSKRAAEIMDWKTRISFAEGLRLTSEWEKAASQVVRLAAVPTTTKRISAIIACYHDHQSIPIMHERLSRVFQSVGVDYEIIFVNDRSPTDDEEVIKRLCKEDAHVIGISHSRNFGSQAAFLSGMGVATGDAVILMDGDLQDPPEVIPQFVERWNEGHDVVYGIRVKREAAFYMQILYKLFYRVFKRMADVDIPLDAGDFSLIDRKAVEHLISLPERDVFLRGLRAWVGFRQVGVAYVRPERLFGTTTNSFFKNIWWAKKAIFSFSTKPLNYIQRTGIALFGATVILILYYLINYFLNPHQNPRGVNTMILLILGLGGLQLFAVSLLGDYLGKVLEEVKNRPHYIRSRILKGRDVFESSGDIADFIHGAREFAARRSR